MLKIIKNYTIDDIRAGSGISPRTASTCARSPIWCDLSGFIDMNSDYSAVKKELGIIKC